MHKWAKQVMECVKSKVEEIGIDNFEGQNLDDLKDWTEIAKNIVCFDKDYSIVEAMKDAENEDNMSMIEQYEDYPARRYYDDYRYKSSGRFAPKGRGTRMSRRGYDEPPYWHREPEDERDMDRQDYGRMYYTEPVMMDGKSGSEMMESRYDKAKRHYTETKAMHKTDSTDDKEHKMKALENYMKELGVDISDMVNDMTEEEKNMMRSKLTTLVSKI